MGINKLRHFALVFETGSIRKAADVLNMSSGSLSKSIKSLENEMSCALFVPEGRNIQASDIAKRIYSDSKKLIREYDQLISTSNKKAEKPVPFRIGTWEVFSSYFLARYALENPDPLMVLERVPESLEQSILNNETDIGITYIPVPHPELEYLKICKFRFMAYARHDCFRSVKLEETPFAVPVSCIEDSPIGVRTLDNWPSNVARKVQFQFELLETALESCRLGSCAIYAPDFVVSLQNQLLDNRYQLKELTKFKSLTSKPYEVFIVKRKNRIEGREIKKLAKILRQSMVRSSN
jgi:DNA-binding transcriptional LysR family regulator